MNIMSSEETREGRGKEKKWAVSKKPDPGPRTSLRFAN